MDLKNMSAEDAVKALLARELAKEEAAEAEAKKAAEEAKFVTVDALKSLLAELKGELEASLTAQVEKAMPVRSEGAGRVGQEAPAKDARDENPVAYLAEKAAKGEMTDEDKELAARITIAVIGDGMKE